MSRGKCDPRLWSRPAPRPVDDHADRSEARDAYLVKRLNCSGLFLDVGGYRARPSSHVFYIEHKLALLLTHVGRIGHSFEEVSLCAVLQGPLYGPALAFEEGAHTLGLRPRP